MGPYARSAKYYDAIYSFKNYKKETEKLQRIIKRYRKTPGKTLLDVACGTGNHITHLKRLYAVEGLDLNPTMLKQARSKHLGIKFYKGDMTSFRLGKHYDVVTCLFSAIGFVKTKRRLRRAIASMAKHLKPGGLVLVEPWFSPRQWSIGSLHGVFVNQPDLKLARISISNRNGNMSFNDEHFLVGTKRGIEYFVERLEMGLFTPEVYVDSLRDAGLSVKHDPEGPMGRGLYIGIKNTE